MRKIIKRLSELCFILACSQAHAEIGPERLSELRAKNYRLIEGHSAALCNSYMRQLRENKLYNVDPFCSRTKQFGNGFSHPASIDLSEYVESRREYDYLLANMLVHARKLMFGYDYSVDSLDVLKAEVKSYQRLSRIRATVYNHDTTPKLENETKLVILYVGATCRDRYSNVGKPYAVPFLFTFSSKDEILSYDSLGREDAIDGIYQPFVYDANLYVDNLVMKTKDKKDVVKVVELSEVSKNICTIEIDY